MQNTKILNNQNRDLITTLIVLITWYFEWNIQATDGAMIKKFDNLFIYLFISIVYT